MLHVVSKSLGAYMPGIFFYSGAVHLVCWYNKEETGKQDFSYPTSLQITPYTQEKIL